MRPLGTTRAAGLLLLTCGSLALAGCGTEHFKNNPRPLAATELTGVIQPKGVSISPDRVAGPQPVQITISNQTKEAHTVTLEGGDVRETVGPIQPLDTGTIQKTLRTGTYQVTAGSDRAVARAISPGAVHVGSKKGSSSNQLLLP
jgi:hypothetical protein